MQPTAFAIRGHVVENALTLGTGAESIGVLTRVPNVTLVLQSNCRHCMGERERERGHLPVRPVMTPVGTAGRMH